VEPGEIKKVIIAIASIGGTPLPITPTIALTAVSNYERHGGPRRLHYFDAYHAATAHHNELPLITSDKYLIEHQKELGIQALDLRRL
jgi:predicted nucleic acid-binding protein